MKIKTLLPISLAIGLALCWIVRAATTPSGPVVLTLLWQDTNAVPGMTNYVAGTNSAYLLIGTNDVTQPISTWPVLRTWTQWSLTNDTSGTWIVQQYTTLPDHLFFSVIVSNFWGMSLPSNLAQTGPPSTPAFNLSVRR